MTSAPLAALCRVMCRLPLARVSLTAAILAVGLFVVGTGWGLLAAGFLAALSATGHLSVLTCALLRRDTPEARPKTREHLVDALDGALRGSRTAGRGAVAMVVGLDQSWHLSERLEAATVTRIHELAEERIRSQLLSGEIVVPLEACRFGVAISPGRGLDLDGAMQLAGHLQRALAAVMDLGSQRVGVSASIGFALAERMAGCDGQALLRAADLASMEASRNGPSAIRSYSESLRERIRARRSLTDEVAAALESGEIRGWFQPQVSAETGAITGMETLARWEHPFRGLVPPSEFLPAIREAGMMQALGTRMVTDALTALTHWDAKGFHVPAVAVNFSTDELSDPGLVERVGWELDSYDLPPERLVVEVLETVVAATREDLVISNLAALSHLGCHLDLDDFGTGHAAITSIRKLSIGRIKIDRSFVAGIDGDTDQQKMVAAILTMAERLGLDTLAEGVETEAEQRMLVELGCGHLQGFGIARPMPLTDVDSWLERRAPSMIELLPLRPTGS